MNMYGLSYLIDKHTGDSLVVIKRRTKLIFRAAAMLYFEVPKKLPQHKLQDFEDTFPQCFGIPHQSAIAWLPT
jgi:hypothetical protein